MQAVRRWRAAVLVVGALAAATALGVAVTGAVLARTYRPLPPLADGFAVPGDVAASQRLEGWHELGVLALVPLALAAVLVCLPMLLGVRGGVSRPSVVGLVAGGLLVVAAAATAITWGMVPFDQIALRSVTVGTGISGFWYAAFGDDVAFVLVGGYEVSQGAYAAALVVHLGAPIAAVLANGGVVRTALVRLRSAVAEPTSPSEAPDPGGWSNQSNESI